MTLEDAKRLIADLKTRFDAPYSSGDKSTIEGLYSAVLGKTFVPTSCQNCYHDAVIEIYRYIKINNAMKKKSKYTMRAGFIINCPTFRGGQIFSNDNLTDEVAEEYIKRFPSNRDLFDVAEDAPEDAPDGGGKKGGGKKGGGKPKKNKKSAKSSDEEKPTTDVSDGGSVNNTSDEEKPTTDENSQK